MWLDTVRDDNGSVGSLVAFISETGGVAHVFRVNVVPTLIATGTLDAFMDEVAASGDITKVDISDSGVV